MENSCNRCGIDFDDAIGHRTKKENGLENGYVKIVIAKTTRKTILIVKGT